MEPIRITYRIGLNDKVTEVFDFDLDGKTFELISDPIPNPPNWTELAFKQCSHCPLKVEEHTHCPMALQLSKVIDRFHHTRSIDEVKLEVIMEDRTVVQTTALQRVLSSMLGLIFPTCGCPKTAYMRPMARFHQPLASEEETVFRVAGMYLVAQYFLTHNSNSRKGEFAFDGLISIYEDFHILNKAIASRLQFATDSDSSKNAITLLDMYSSLVPMLLEDQLAEIRGFFTAFLPEDDMKIEAPANNYLEKARAFALELETDLALAPVGGPDNSDIPAWLREVKAETTPDSPKVVIPSAIDEILSKSTFSFSLEMDGDNIPAPTTGKAVFMLPDDVPPPKHQK